MCKVKDGFHLLIKGNVTVLYQRYSYGQPLTQCVQKELIFSNNFYNLDFIITTLLVIVGCLYFVSSSKAYTKTLKQSKNVGG